MLGAYNEQTVGTRASTETGRDDASYKVATEDFDELVKSGQTMKVSLTPSRLKNFEVCRLAFTDLLGLVWRLSMTILSWAGIRVRSKRQDGGEYC